jgi:hypothetical protein
MKYQRVVNWIVLCGLVWVQAPGVSGTVWAAGLPCESQTFSSSKNPRHACVKQLQAKIKAANVPVSVDGVFGNATVNAVLNFQRSQVGLTADGVVGPKTWRMLNAPQYVEMGLAPKCKKSSGIMLCANQASRKLWYVKDGAVVKEINVRFGGWAKDPKSGAYSLKKTAKGSFRIIQGRKYADYTSKTFEAAMPYSMFFYGGQAFHYSANFARAGYSGASHGCINIGNLDEAKWLFANTPEKTAVYVY